MKKFKTNEYGLLPVFLNDIAFMQTACQEQIEALIKPWLEFTNDNSFILSGIEEIEGQQHHYTGGWVVLDGKLYEVDAFVINPNPGFFLKWFIETFNQPEGTKTPKRSTTTVETHELQKAKARQILIGTPTIECYPFNLPRFADIIAKIQEREFIQTQGDGYNLQFSKHNDKYVLVVGNLYPNTVTMFNEGKDNILIPGFPWSIDPAFQEGFDMRTIITVYATDALPSVEHNAKAYKCWVSITPLSNFSFTVSPAELGAEVASLNFEACVHINALLKLA